jgi:hypothetical protein
MGKYGHSFLCSKCARLWKHVGTLHRHERTCTGDVIYKYPGSVYHTAQTTFDRLEDEGIDVPEEDRYYPYRATLMWCYSLQRRDDPRSWSGPVTMCYSACLCVPTFLCVQFQCATSRRVIPERQWSPVWATWQKSGRRRTGDWSPSMETCSSRFRKNSTVIWTTSWMIKRENARRRSTTSSRYTSS